jgi:hypothetical protein
MAIVESRLREGTVLLGTAPDEMDISCQLTNVRLTSAYSDDGDAVETLCGDKIAAGEKADGYTPNVTAPTVTGKLRLKLPGEFLGGDVNVRLTSDFEWTITSELDRTPPVAGTTTSGSTTTAVGPATSAAAA